MARHFRLDRATTVNDVNSIDIRYMNQNGLLDSPGGEGTLFWSRNGKRTGEVHYRIEKDSLVLNYIYQEAIEQKICFYRTPCNYGGERLWFCCPECQKKVAIVYGAGKYFLCRHCYKLPYRCQRESDGDRLLRKAYKIREKLRVEDNLVDPVYRWDKPKWMRWKTFERLQKEDSEARNAIDQYAFDRWGVHL